MKKSRSKIKIEKSIMLREKTKNKSKIQLLYNSKLKSNIIGKKIREKTYNLTYNRARNDLIDH